MYKKAKQRQECQHCVCTVCASTAPSVPVSLKGVCVRTRTRAWCVMPSFPQGFFSVTSHIFKAMRLIAWPEHEERQRREGDCGGNGNSCFSYFRGYFLIPPHWFFLHPPSEWYQVKLVLKKGLRAAAEQWRERIFTELTSNFFDLVADLCLSWYSVFMMLFVVCLCFSFLSPFEQNENNNLLLISCFLLFLVFFFDFSLATVIFFWIFSFLFFPPFFLNPRSTHKKTWWINTEPATRWRYFCCMFFLFSCLF